MLEEYTKKDLEELEKLLPRLKDELEEIEEERMFVLSQQGYHLPGATVKKYEAEVAALKKRIEACTEAIHKKQISQ